MRPQLLATLLCLAGCSEDVAAAPPSDGGADGDALVDAPPAVDWTIEIDPSTAGPTVSRYLLGQYDLSGALYDFAKVEGLSTLMKQAGFSEWRVGVGRWELGTQLLPALTDGTACPTIFPKTSLAPEGSTDLSLVAGRDWFTDDGKPVTLAMTADDTRYALGYARSAIDQATAFGVEPWVDVDLMPRALAKNRTFSRTTSVIPDACMATFTNAVSNSAPADATVFAAAAVGLVRRLVEGSGSEKGRPLTRVEIWNEPEYPYFWDKAHEPKGGLDEWVKMAAVTLVSLADYRSKATAPAAKALKFGFGSFAVGDTAIALLGAFDKTALPDGSFLPIDFVSFHAYDNDPLAVAAKVDAVAAARRSSTHYQNVELALAEWGLALDAKGWDPATMDVPLHTATVLTLAATAGIEHAHRSIFYDYYAGIPFGIVGNDRKPKPGFHAYTLLAQVVGGARVPVKNAVNGRLDGGLGVVLVTKDAGGKVRALIVNRATSARNVEISVGGAVVTASALSVFDTPSAAPSARDVARTLRLPPRSIALVSL